MASPPPPTYQGFRSQDLNPMCNSKTLKHGAVWPPARHYYYHGFLQMRKLRHREAESHAQGHTAGKEWAGVEIRAAHCKHSALLIHRDHGSLWPGFQRYVPQLMGLVAFFAPPAFWVLRVLISHPSSGSYLTQHNTGLSCLLISHFPLQVSACQALPADWELVCSSLTLPLGNPQHVSIALQHCSRLLVNFHLFPEPLPHLKAPPHHEKAAIWVDSFIHWSI